jgi:hypothetical protein
VRNEWSPLSGKSQHLADLFIEPFAVEPRVLIGVGGVTDLGSNPQHLRFQPPSRRLF